ncbi:single-stranded-DNA-specific exonuclease RecJ [Aquisalimonas lutea]|uniref:single-stranded-DNA-specific exonuclease RecJ n=1 Tax=Aquisalimonas lutea TaxID=1327750 RepID=UPI0025B28DDD|nr:single-stranded-DNA-specific exonuclease RecJ [Aquisalimonas lutea]MDN3518417.1 single-stranded-DNA-specific exonuclease RecJ [Aquisalimonas lutea]
MRIRRRCPDPAAESALSGLPPVLRRVYAGRGVDHPDELRQELGALAPTDGLHGLEAAVGCLARAMIGDRRILVVGDFDADGASSCALALLALRGMGARHVDYLVPNRFEYGYGLSPEIVAEAARSAPDLLVTVDNGISSADGVAAAHAHGMEVLVTDHHLPPEHLPDARAIVNPNLPGDGFPSKHLAGVGVIFYVLAGLRQELQRQGWFADAAPPQLGTLLDLVALGTVADLVPLDHNNRILVEQGLRRIRAGRGRPGIIALLEVAGRDPSCCTATDLAFAAAPRLNAAGRLDDMAVGIECLLAGSPGEAAELAGRLDALNRERRSIESRMEEEAVAGVNALTDTLAEGGAPPGICVTDETWHQGVVGIVASRLKERFHRPVVAFAPVAAGELKGSARSVPGLHMRDVLERVATDHPGLIERFGGHAGAAGLTLRTDHFAAFREAFVAAVDAALPAEDRDGVHETDGPLRPGELTLELAHVLRDAGPWGQGFPEPSFDGCFRVQQARVVGQRHLKMRLQPEEGDTVVDAIAFRALDAGWDERLPSRIHAVYRLDVNRWQGRESLQLVVEAMATAASRE